jgi:hypothetical protein
LISYNLMWNKSYSILILNNYHYDNYLNSNRYNELNVSKGHICNFLQNSHNISGSENKTGKKVGFYMAFCVVNSNCSSRVSHRSPNESSTRLDSSMKMQ